MNPRPLLIVQSERLSASDPALFGKIGDMAAMFCRILDGGDLRLEVVNPAEGEALPEPATLAGAIICGAGAMAGDNDPWIERLGAWLEQAVAEELPLLGVCFGHQLLARRLGGAVGPNATGAEYGTVEIALTPAAREDRLMGGMASGVVAVQAAHFQTVSRLPAGAVLLASGGSGVHAARFGTSCWGLQFHPEFSAQDMRSIIPHVAEKQSSPLGLPMLEAVPKLRETPEIENVIRRFADIATGVTNPAASEFTLARTPSYSTKWEVI